MVVSLSRNRLYLLFGASLALASAPAFAQGITAKPPAFIGDTGIILSVAMGCAQESDTKAFVNSYAKAEVAGDQVGEGDAVETAMAAGCQPTHPGDTGLVIDSNGFFEGYTELRLQDGSAVWVMREAVGDLSGPMHQN